MPNLEELLHRDRAFYRVFSVWEERPWGALGCNPHNPGSHDSNHAYAERRLTPQELGAVLKEVAEWYGQRGLQPRLRVHVPPNDPQLIGVARGLGWQTLSEEETYRAWLTQAGVAEPAEVQGLALAVASSDELEALLAVHNDGADEATAFRHRGVWSAFSRHPETDCLLARIGAEPAASLVCVWDDDWGNIGAVATRPSFRRHGICRAMICHAQGLAAARNATGLFLYHVEEGPGRIYASAGFELVGRAHQVSIWLPQPSPRDADERTVCASRAAGGR